jgi:hypothetical protein
MPHLALICLPFFDLDPLDLPPVGSTPCVSIDVASLMGEAMHALLALYPDRIQGFCRFPVWRCSFLVGDGPKESIPAPTALE